MFHGNNYDRHKSSKTQLLSKISYTYDPTNLSLDLETTQYDLDRNGSYEFTRVLDRSSDALLRDTGFKLQEGTTVENQATYTYGTNDGRLASIRSEDTPVPTNTFAYQYLPNSNLIEKVISSAHEVKNTWKENRDVLDLKQNKVASIDISKYDYSTVNGGVNKLGQRMGVKTTFNLGADMISNPGDTSWGYDSLGQVTSANHSTVNTSDRSYQYDSIGNRKKSANSLTLPTSDNYTSNAVNQYNPIQEGGIYDSRLYDFDGNAKKYPLPVAPTTNSTLTWDAENRMISSTIGSVTTTYAYDAYSRRIAKTTGSASTLYLYDDWNCIAEYTGSTAVSPVLNKTRLWGLDLSGTLQGAGGVGGMLAESSLITSNPISFNTFYPTYDGNDNVSEYLNSTGQVTAHFEYDPFGNAVVNTDASSQFAYRFSTKPLDLETGFYYYGYRYYDPVTGRWPSRDPIEEAGGLNLYGFIANDPISWVDILGLKCCAKNDEIYAKIDEGGQEATKLSIADQAARQKIENDKVKGTKFYAATAPFYEYGGKVCCKDKNLYLSDITTDASVKEVHLEKSRCNEGDDTVGFFHNHPNNTPPSKEDKGIARRGKPYKFGPDGKGDYDPTKDTIPPRTPVGATGADGKTRIYDPSNGSPDSFPYPPSPKLP